MDMLIDFVHAGDAYMPELAAYADYLRAAGHGARIHRAAGDVPADARVVWWMCGQVPGSSARRHPSAFQVHEYASASVPPLAWLKDRSKRWLQPVPQHRVFQNEWVRDRLAFADGAPHDLRDMGVAPAFFDAAASPNAPDVDFVYLGEMQRLRHFLAVFAALEQAGHSVLLVGQMPDALWPHLRRFGRLTATGRVAHDQVPGLLRRARVALNLVPDVVPYSRQTSTKLLEYCAVGLPVLTTDYRWVRDFERLHGGHFSYLPVDGGAQALARCVSWTLEHSQRPPDVRDLCWPRLLAGLRVWRTIGIAA